MHNFLILDKNTAVQVTEITNVKLDHRGLDIDFYLKDGKCVTKSVTEPVTMEHILRIIRVTTTLRPEDEPSFVEWDAVSERVTNNYNELKNYLS